MKMTWMIRVIGTSALLVIGIARSISPTQAVGANLQPMVVTNVTGDLHIAQSLPGTCDNVDQRTPVTGARLELTPAQGVPVPGGRQFLLTRASVSFAPFTVERHCMTQDVTKVYDAVGVHLSRAVSFVAVEQAPNLYTFAIPKDDVVLYEGAVINSDPEPAFLRPKQDVTGTIDFANRTIQIQVAIATKIHIQFGCVPYVGCAVDDDYHGTLTASLSGTIALPDADRDGVTDDADNCRFVPNADQAPVATPIVTAPADVTVASCLDNQIGLAVGADVCDAQPVTVTNDAPAAFALGANVVTWSGTDAKGRSDTDTQDVTVVDTTPPSFTFVPLDIARNNCGPVGLGTPTATDDCAGAPSFSNDAPAYFLEGATVVTWTARDVSGNPETATQTVTVTDTTPPEVSCISTDPGGGSFFRVVANDACQGPTTARLGAYAIANGEVIKINQVVQPGVRLVSTSTADGVRHFHVGKGQAVITAVDKHGNPATAICFR